MIVHTVGRRLAVFDGITGQLLVFDIRVRDHHPGTGQWGGETQVCQADLTFRGTPSPGRGTRPYYPSGGRSSKPRTSCLGAIGLLILMLAVSGMLTNLATHITYGLTHASPHPAPAITTTVPHQ